jgi:hypothetical protein
MWEHGVDADAWGLQSGSLVYLLMYVGTSNTRDNLPLWIISHLAISIHVSSNHGASVAILYRLEVKSCVCPTMFCS